MLPHYHVELSYAQAYSVLFLIAWVRLATCSNNAQSSAELAVADMHCLGTRAGGQEWSVAHAVAIYWAAKAYRLQPPSSSHAAQLRAAPQTALAGRW